MSTSPASPHPSAPDQSFPKRLRLRKRAEFLRVQQRSRRFSGQWLHFLYMPPASPEPLTGRVGFTVSKKVGKAPVRNRVRRRLRELFRLNRGRWPLHLDVVVVAQPRAHKAEWKDLCDDVERWLARWARPS